MTQGIRDFSNATFTGLLPQRAELTNTGFRKAVMAAIIAQFQITIASAATHYNHSLKVQRANNPESVKDLGRPDDKKGGRKAIYTVEVIKVKTGEVVASGLSKAAAEEMIAKAATARKAKLAIKAPVVVETVAVDTSAVETPTEAVAEVTA